MEKGLEGKLTVNVAERNADMTNMIEIREPNNTVAKFICTCKGS